MKKRTPQPPKWADRFLTWFCAEELLEEIQGDLYEAFHCRVEAYGRGKAKRFFIADVFRFFKPYAFEKYSRAKQFLPMFDNYFKIALRNILHRKGFTAINLIGLSIGISAVMLIGLYLKNELAYDRVTPEYEQVFRLMNHYRDQVYSPMQFRDFSESSPETQLRLPEQIRQDEAVEYVAHFVPSQSAIGGGSKYFIEVDQQRFVAENALYTNTGAAFQQIFPQQFLVGTPEAAYAGFNKIILTEQLARRWFGARWSTQELLGKPLIIQEEIYELAGVIADVPDNVHYDFDFIIHQKSIPSWAAYTYLKLQPDASIREVLTRLNQEVDKVYPGYTADVLSKGISAVALKDIHFTPGTLYELKPIANKAYLTTFAIVALVILLIIWTNYTNLSIAMYADRQKELGMRKVLGARPEDISFQLLVEAVLLALLCFPFCWLLVRGLLPYFNELMDVGLSQDLMLRIPNLLTLGGLLLVTGLLSGIYPAVVYSRRSSLHLFGPQWNKLLSSRYFNFRNVLVTLQFTMAVTLLGITGFIYQQMHYIQNKDLGFQREGILYFGIDGAEKYNQLKKALLALPEVEEVGANGVPGSDMYNQGTYQLKDTDVTLSDGTEQYLDFGSLKTLEIPCVACAQLEAGKDRIFVINRTAAAKLAKIKGVEPEALIGETLITEPEWENEQYGNGIPHVIDGIIDDYQFFSLKYPDQSQLITVTKQPGYVYEMLVRANTQNWTATLKKIEAAYAEIEKEAPFDFTFLEDRLNQLYSDERRSGMLLFGLCFVVIILALMGLSGIVTYVAYNRQKEIGIRKILGASAGNILLKFNQEFMLLMGIATFIALPIALFLSSRWLDSFAFRIQPQAWVVLLSGLGALLLVALLVSIQASRAALKQPVEALRSE